MHGAAAGRVVEPRAVSGTREARRPLWTPPGRVVVRHSPCTPWRLPAGSRIHARADRDEQAYHIHAVIMPRTTVRKYGTDY